MNPTSPRSIPSGLVQAPLPWLPKLNLGALGVLAAAFSFLLWPQWLHNPDLSHGLFMPLVCLVLVHESRTVGVQRFLPNSLFVKLAFVGALLVAVAALILGGLYAAASEWSHPVVSLMLATALCGLMAATLLGFAQESVRLIPFNWSAILAAGLWVLSAPIPPGSYSRLTFGLQLWVSENVVRSLSWLGVAASRQGNIIELANTSVGVEEACSGVRSLVSCIFAGLFFSGCLVRRPWSRVVLIALSAPLALGMNFLRSLTLTLLANSGTEISGAWHDITGFSVLVLTASILGLVALRLSRQDEPRPQKTSVVTPSVDSRLSLQGPLFGGFALIIVLSLFFAFSTNRNRTPVSGASPDLEAVLPLSVRDWNVSTTLDLDRFKDALRTDHFVQRTYTKVTPAGPLQMTAYIAYWAPGQATASQVATHTPDACWPGAGWSSISITDTHESVRAGDRMISPAEHRLFSSNNYPQHVWFWHLYDQHPVEYLDPLSPRNVIKIALRHGFHREGDQLFVRLSSNQPWSSLADEPLISEIFAHLQPFGL